MSYLKEAIPLGGWKILGHLAIDYKAIAGLSLSSIYPFSLPTIPYHIITTLTTTYLSIYL